MLTSVVGKLICTCTVHVQVNKISSSCICVLIIFPGESVPITKTPVPMEQVEYSPHKHKRHTLFAGTQIIQARYYSQDMVLVVVCV